VIRPVETRKHAVILNEVPQGKAGGGTQLKDPVELPAPIFPLLSFGRSTASRTAIWPLRDSAANDVERTGIDVAGNSTGSFSCVPPAALPLRNFVQDDRVLARLYGPNHVTAAPKTTLACLETSG